MTIYDGEEEKEQIVLSDYKTKEEMHVLMVEKGFQRKSDEEIAEMMAQKDKEAAEEAQRKHQEREERRRQQKERQMEQDQRRKEALLEEQKRKAREEYGDDGNDRNDEL
mmetsp:Transcript_31043/g.65513  ORF Transcript_31043/g.65513 Transcript_31043/m.65513 type:complete len:109 (-) Transcript_31043:240-566(-)|eukprot:CAMPEP_0171355404 /NCGR_PEP_ID=MMETSP0878-20121228/45204_1 /TAXON_ID=67004 /ORGANISM="Thalassiosira weissflogii, Strain CCMP1336" /LENGTH=108 /DNA_ID=CAMNT_0011861405 /DNA_START=272 /DNA_END=598 /DNA_ORIENTATION=+